MTARLGVDEALGDHRTCDFLLASQERFDPQGITHATGTVHSKRPESGVRSVTRGRLGEGC